jgi:hypothetical protein
MIKYLLFLIFLNITKLAYSEEGFESSWAELRVEEKLNLTLEKEFPKISNIEEVISYQTSVKRQRSRGTCTIFTTTGLIESYLKRKAIISNLDQDDYDFSEEWLEYLAMRKKTSEGSSTSINMRNVLENGMPHEKDWEYIGQKWLSVDDFSLAKERCGNLENDLQLSCLWGHRNPLLLDLSDKELMNPKSQNFDPVFKNIRQSAQVNLKKIITNTFKKRKSFKIHDLKWVKTYLNKGYPLIMGLKLYYGSWNHSKTEKFDIQPRDKDKWYQGIVGYPEPGSKDKSICDIKGGGHSLIIVGYDDERIIKTKMLMENGSYQDFSYKGVYYFKNSWGTGGSGRDFTLNGIAYPGYGVITQKYAHEHGRFFHFPLKKTK